VRVILHGVADDVGDLDETAVVLFMQRPENAALHWLEAVGQIGDGAVADDVGGIFQKTGIDAAMQRFARFFPGTNGRCAMAGTSSASTWLSPLPLPLPLAAGLALPAWQLTPAAFNGQFRLFGLVLRFAALMPVYSRRDDQVFHDVILALWRVLAHVKAKDVLGVNLGRVFHPAQAHVVANELLELGGGDFAQPFESGNLRLAAQGLRCRVALGFGVAINGLLLLRTRNSGVSSTKR